MKRYGLRARGIGERDDFIRSALAQVPHLERAPPMPNHAMSKERTTHLPLGFPGSGGWPALICKLALYSGADICPDANASTVSTT